MPVPVSRTAERQRHGTERLLRELPSVDPALRAGLFRKWSDAKERSQVEIENGSSGGGGEPSIRDRAPAPPPPRKPPQPRRAKPAAPPAAAATAAPATPERNRSGPPEPVIGGLSVPKTAGERAKPAAPAPTRPAARAKPAAPAPARPAPAPAPRAKPAAPAPAQRPAAKPAAPVAAAAAPSRRGRRLAIAAVLLALAAGSVTAALLLDSDESAGLTVGDPARVSLTGEWLERSAPAVPGFGPGATGYRLAGDGSGSSLTVGTVEASASSMLPEALLRRLDGPAPRPTIRERPDAWVFTYPDLRLTGARDRLTVHLIATDRGTAGLACRAAGPSFTTRCDAAADTLRPAPGATAHRGLSPQYAAALDRTIRDVGQARRSARADLVNAYELAARRLRGLGALRVRPELRAVNARIVGALERTASAYRANDRASIARNEADLRAALRGLAGLGYRPAPID